ncbi:unnamed protein product [Durusdinium trenchii]
MAVYDMERSKAGVDVVAAMVRSGTTWKMQIIEEPAEQGQHFMDILPLLSTVIRRFLPSAPVRQKVAFAMEKGGVLDMPLGMGSITVGLGWDVDQGEVDLDVSAVLLNDRAEDVEAVFFGHLESIQNGIVHSGDNLTGDGDGDDEQIQVDLNRIQPHVQQVFFVVNIYSANRSFRQVARPYCRIVDNMMGNELCRYSLSDAGNDNGLIIAKMARETGGRWGFHALGMPCRGRTYKDSMKQIQQAANVKTHALMLRSSTLETDHLDLAPSAPPADRGTGVSARDTKTWVPFKVGLERAVSRAEEGSVVQERRCPNMIELGPAWFISLPRSTHTERLLLVAVTVRQAKLFDEEMEVLHVTQEGKFTGGALVKELSVKARHVEGSSNLNLQAPSSTGTQGEILGTTTVGYIDSMASELQTQSGRVMWDFITGMSFICIACHSILRQKTVDFWQATSRPTRRPVPWGGHQPAPELVRSSERRRCPEENHNGTPKPTWLGRGKPSSKGTGAGLRVHVSFRECKSICEVIQFSDSADVRNTRQFLAIAVDHCCSSLHTASHERPETWFLQSNYTLCLDQVERISFSDYVNEYLISNSALYYSCRMCVCPMLDEETG